MMVCTECGEANIYHIYKHKILYYPKFDCDKYAISIFKEKAKIFLFNNVNPQPMIVFFQQIK